MKDGPKLSLSINELIRAKVLNSLNDTMLERVCEHHIFCRILGLGEQEVGLVSVDGHKLVRIYDFMFGIVTGLVTGQELDKAEAEEIMANLYSALYEDLPNYKQEVQ